MLSRFGRSAACALERAAFHYRALAPLCFQNPYSHSQIVQRSGALFTEQEFGVCLVVAFVAGILPKKPLSLEEILLLGLVAATTFSILDTFIPSVASSARHGAGLGLGANLVGFPAM